MFIILVYDINQKRVGKVLKICRKYLTHVQKSVFEGELTSSQVLRLEKELNNIVHTEEDSVCIYQLESLKYTKKLQIGVTEKRTYII